jgi:hypothetical protein
VKVGRLPCAFDSEGFEGGGFVFVEVVLDYAVDACSAGTATEAEAQLSEVFRSAGCYDFDVSLIRVADPAGEAEFAGLAVYEPAKADALHATLDEEMKNHGVVTMASVADGAARRNFG